jgi:hypothetical protein
MNLKANNLIALIFILSMLIACNDPSKKEKVDTSVPVVINKYSSYGLDFSDTTNLTIVDTDSVKLHFYGMTYDNAGEMDSYLEVPYGINPEDSSSIFINNDRAKLVAEKVYTLDKEQVKVQKYYFDLANEVDEEAYYFVANNRIVALNLVPFNLQKFYIYEDSKIEVILRNDSTDFFNFLN